MQHRLKSLLPILLAPIFLACGAIAQEKGHAGKPIHVRGTLTDEGVECQALRSTDGHLYTLTGDLGGFKAGDKVKVKGRLAEVSTCQQGTTLGVEEIEEDKGER